MIRLGKIRLDKGRLGYVRFEYSDVADDGGWPRRRIRQESSQSDGPTCCAIVV